MASKNLRLTPNRVQDLELRPEMRRVRQGPQPPCGLRVSREGDVLHLGTGILDEKGLLTVETDIPETGTGQDGLDRVPKHMAGEVLRAEVLEDRSRKLITAIGPRGAGR